MRTFTKHIFEYVIIFKWRLKVEKYLTWFYNIFFMHDAYSWIYISLTTNFKFTLTNAIWENRIRINTPFILKVDVCLITNNLPHNCTNMLLIVCNNWCCFLTYQVFIWLVSTFSPIISTDLSWNSIKSLNHSSCKLTMIGLVWWPSFVIAWCSEWP